MVTQHGGKLILFSQKNFCSCLCSLWV